MQMGGQPRTSEQGTPSGGMDEVGVLCYVSHSQLYWRVANILKLIPLKLRKLLHRREDASFGPTKDQHRGGFDNETFTRSPSEGLPARVGGYQPSRSRGGTLGGVMDSHHDRDVTLYIR